MRSEVATFFFLFFSFLQPTRASSHDLSERQEIKRENKSAQMLKRRNKLVQAVEHCAAEAHRHGHPPPTEPAPDPEDRQAYQPEDRQPPTIDAEPDVQQQWIRHGVSLFLIYGLAT
jgi:hypothetical protein